MGGDFSQREVSWHINAKEAVALENSLALFCSSNLDEIKGKTVIVKVDNQVLSYIYTRVGVLRVLNNKKSHVYAKDCFGYSCKHSSGLNYNGYRWERTRQME